MSNRISNIYQLPLICLTDLVECVVLKTSQFVTFLVCQYFTFKKYIQRTSYYFITIICFTLVESVKETFHNSVSIQMKLIGIELPFMWNIFLLECFSFTCYAFTSYNIQIDCIQMHLKNKNKKHPCTDIATNLTNSSNSWVNYLLWEEAIHTKVV